MWHLEISKNCFDSTCSRLRCSSCLHQFFLLFTGISGMALFTPLDELRLSEPSHFESTPVTAAATASTTTFCQVLFVEGYCRVCQCGHEKYLKWLLSCAGRYVVLLANGTSETDTPKVGVTILSICAHVASVG